jgi:UDP-N-acetylglucosamine 2-epimerase (non-hydrolysing)
MAPVILKLRSRPQLFETIVIATAQHREMLDQMMDLFHIKVDLDLDLMEHDQSPAQMAQKAMAATNDLLGSLQPDLILVQGDTTTAMATSMAAFMNRIPVGHVEAGLRSFDRFNPFPEEFNRRIVSMVADWHFAPTAQARLNLLNERVDEKSIYVTGNTVIDSLFAVVNKQLPLEVPELANTDFQKKKVILVTAHRRENHGEALRRICEALRDLVSRNSTVEVVYPVHPNPNVETTVRSVLSGHPRIHLVAPLGYGSLVSLMTQCYLILTDSGGIQEEAPSLGKPVLVLRRVTERPEAVEAGASRLIGTNNETIVRETERLLCDEEAYAGMAQSKNPYGDGKAAWRIAEILKESFMGTNCPVEEWNPSESTVLGTEGAKNAAQRS